LSGYAVVHLTHERATELATQVLQAAGAGLAMAQAAAQCLVQAESQGLVSHGLYRLGQYATHLRNGRANGAAVPTVLRPKPAVLVIDAQGGLAFGACALAVEQALVVAREQGVCFAGVVTRRVWWVWLFRMPRRPCPLQAAGTPFLAPTRWRRYFRAARATR
jgi:LDH2 family malate/lactate/ureidoglycolate dehydrogenase